MEVLVHEITRVTYTQTRLSVAVQAILAWTIISANPPIRRTA